MADQPEPLQRTLFVVVIPQDDDQEKVTFYPERSAAEKAAKASLTRPGVVYPLSV